ncbi:hypothetical protein Ahy_Scaffold1g106754 isoform B [Arachis hypogaea]|uniref:Uncharacterized protein n=1 Tax=Arachis hypogaea TaxID=3818 RepID=A0A444WRY9_ARAHY|nr:hypothetical protein Ahy_Scaffold1g106754 isoform B [Arachis hypogaea]
MTGGTISPKSLENLLRTLKNTMNSSNKTSTALSVVKSPSLLIQVYYSNCTTTL